MAAAWTYSGWINYQVGDPRRLQQLRLHIAEVSDRISQGSYNVQGKSHDFAYLQEYLKTLFEREKEEIAAGATAAGTETFIVRAVPIRPGGGLS